MKPDQKQSSIEELLVLIAEESMKYRKTKVKSDSLSEPLAKLITILNGLYTVIENQNIVLKKWGIKEPQVLICKIGNSLCAISLKASSLFTGSNNGSYYGNSSSYTFSSYHLTDSYLVADELKQIQDMFKVILEEVDKFSTMTIEGYRNEYFKDMQSEILPLISAKFSPDIELDPNSELTLKTK